MVGKGRVSWKELVKLCVHYWFVFDAVGVLGNDWL